MGWLHANLFSGVGNTILTLITLAVIYFVVTGLVRWLLTAFWEPVWVNRKLFAVGPYPTDQLGSRRLVLLMVSLLFGLSAGRWGSMIRNLAVGLGAVLGVLASSPSGMQAQLVMAVALALLDRRLSDWAQAPIPSRWLVLGGWPAGLYLHPPQGRHRSAASWHHLVLCALVSTPTSMAA